MDYWIAKKPELLPDFIIGGAMKSGTTTIHQILATHPDVYIVPEEVNFFDIDNVLEHPDFSFFHKKSEGWITQNMGSDYVKIWQWYRKKFENKEDFLKGEDSTTYLASPIAAERIAQQKKAIKLVFILRQPSMRAFSNYLHLLRTGRATLSFEGMITTYPHVILNRSMYYTQLQVYYNLFKKERIHIVLFEDLINDSKVVIDGIIDFLSLDKNKFDYANLNIHSNKTKEPYSLQLQLFKNKIFSNYAKFSYKDSLPIMTSRNGIYVYDFFERLYRKTFFKSRNRNLRISDATKSFLDNFFYDNLKGIDQLTGRSIIEKWF
ncbi:MAG: sulfotransferase [Bacteroidota bacterium]